jgi:Leucine-rich repeat (LRR) protein
LFSALPSRIGELKQLQELMLQINSIGGTLPPSIGNLTNLKELRLYGNYLSGTIPETVGNLKSLGKFFEFCSGPA